MQALAVLAALMVVWVGTVYIRVWVPLGWTLVLPRLMAAALLPALVPMAVVFAAISVWLNSNLAAWLFMAVVITAGVAWLRIDAVPCDFGMAFGPNWDARVAPEHQPNLRRRAWRWRLPAAARVTWKRDIPFWTIPETGRVLLCDIWLPPAEVTRSGLAYVYFHGSAWCMLDKDFLTRSIFRHLAAQGHVVMDVAYRLCPETDIPGMVSDVNRAVAWIKEHANEYGVSADRIVVGGSSAGGQISLLAAYGAGVPEFTPPDVQGRDLSVRGVVSCYGPTDLAVCFYHTRQDRIHGIGLTPPDMKTLTSDSGRLGFVKAKASGRLDWIVGGTPDQVPELCTVLAGQPRQTWASPDTADSGRRRPGHPGICHARTRRQTQGGWSPGSDTLLPARHARIRSGFPGAFSCRPTGSARDRAFPGGVGAVARMVAR